jgi:hypothetical protein
MTLTDRESSFLATIRKYQRWWRVVRWFCLPGFVALLISWFWLLHRFISLADEETVGTALLLAWLLPIWWICFVMNCAALGLILVHWNGDMRTQLLLKLIDDHQEPKPCPGAAPNDSPVTSSVVRAGLPPVN